jgi:tetratricopeptide (TPR) repeat protein
MGGLAEAEATLTRVLGRPGLETMTRGIARSQRGLLRARAGNSSGALRDFSEALGAFADEPGLAAKAHQNRGNLHLQNGAFAEARRDFEAVLECLGSPEGDPNYDKALFNISCTEQMSGDLASALKRLDEVEPRLATFGPLYQATIQQMRGEILVAAGLPTQGQAQLAAAASIYARQRLPIFQGEADLVHARSLLQQQPRTARSIAVKAARRFRARGSEVWALRADALALEARVAGGARAADLVTQADVLAPQLRRQRLAHDATLVELYAARTCVRRGDLDEARSRLRRLRLTEATPIATRLLLREVRADLERARGRKRSSYSHLRSGLEELHAWQASFGSLDLQSGVVRHGQQLAIDGLRMAVADSRPEVLFEWSERGRMLVSRVVPVRAPADAAVAAELAELRWLQSQQPEARSREGQRMRELQSAVRQHAWYGDGSGEVSEPVTLEELQLSLGDEQALVAYVATAESVLALVVDGARAVVRPLGQRRELEAMLGGLHADLDMAGAHLPEPFAAPVRRELAARLDRLDALLVAPVADLVGGRLVLTPSGVLAGVPWGLLPGMRGRPVTVARSATSWLARQATPLRSETAGFVAGPRVARAAAEVKAAAGTWASSEVLVGDEATAGAVSDLAARVDVLHVSAHGRHSAENPLFSGVELVDGPWFGYDIDQLAGIPDVVLLSACEVGRSEVRFGEELVGMTTAWLHAGARCVIASAAAVNDDVAHDVLLQVHRGLGAGQDPASALAAAVPAVAEDVAPAPFACFS